jgi:predicted TIM-barrel fold metal-dependent hydrolase
MSMTAYRIDTHEHLVPEVYTSALESIGIHGSGENPWPKWSLAKNLEMLDRMGIAATVSSISSPGTFFGDVAFAKRISRDCNEYSAKIVAEHRSRLGVTAVLPLPDVEAALKELEYALDVLKLDGVSLLTHIGKHYMGQPVFNEFYAELNRRQAVVFLHPVRPPMDGIPEYGFPDGVVELTNDTTRAIANLLYQGVFERFPDIRFIVSHAGGTVPMIIYRLRNMRLLPGVAERIPNSVEYYLKRLYYDVAQSCVPTVLRALQDIAEPSHILFGTDYPFSKKGDAVVSDVIEGIAAYQGFDAELRRKVERDNALALFPRFAS